MISETGRFPAPRDFSPVVKDALAALLHEQEAADRIAEALADQDDGGNNSSTFETIETLRAFAAGINHARKTLLIIATEHSRPQGIA